MKNRILENLKIRVSNMRKTWGNDYVTDISINKNIARYTVDPQSSFGYIVEINLETGKERNHGLGRGCFWTEWE